MKSAEEVAGTVGRWQGWELGIGVESSGREEDRAAMEAWWGIGANERSFDEIGRREEGISGSRSGGRYNGRRVTKDIGYLREEAIGSVDEGRSPTSRRSGSIGAS